MGKRPKKKIVLFLVEGKSDREALQIAISKLYEKFDENTRVEFSTIYHKDTEKRGGDITTTKYTDKRGKKKWVSPENIEDAIYLLFLEKFFDEKKIMPKDISEVIQIVDLDGAYVPDDCILLDSKLSEDDAPFYTNSSINCLDVEKMVLRNKYKRENLNDLCARTTIKIKTQTKPYSIYFFSSNLDHFLHHKANLDNRQKVALADTFSNGFIVDEDVEGFVRFFTEDPDAITGLTYDESWAFIKSGTNSLARHTNFNILLNKLFIGVVK